MYIMSQCQISMQARSAHLAACKGRYAASVPVRYQSDYLHKSIIPTDHFQGSLPRLPIPDLEKTCSRYLDTQRAFLPSSKFEQTKRYAEAFTNGVGKDLQRMLLSMDKANKHTSYVTGSVFDTFLKCRMPSAIYCQPFTSFKPAPRPELNNQLVRATNLVISSLKYCKTLRANILEPEIIHRDPKKSDTEQFRKFVRLLPKAISCYGAYSFKAYPLDMSQLSNLFNSTRIPQQGRDRLYKNEKARHLLVLRNGNMYTFDCFDQNGDILPVSQIMSNIKYILEDQSGRPSHPIGYLPTQNRDVWAQARDHLLVSGNSSQLDLVDTALFSLSLDSEHPEDPATLAKQYLYGDAADRWCDKSLSLFITPQGGTNVSFEHSWGDGLAVMSYCNAIFNDSNNNPAAVSSEVATAEPQVIKLEFNLSDTNKADIDAAKANHSETTSKLSLKLFKYEGLGKVDFKPLQLSPDAMMQLAFQMASKKAIGKAVATSETCSTSTFKHGRTEFFRPATYATNTACDVFNSGAGKAEILSALTECSRVHSQLIKNAIMGQVWDRHLSVLNQLAEKEGLDVPLFSDESYKLVSSDAIDTSAIPSPAMALGGYAPVGPHSLGICYGIHDNRLDVVVTAFKPRSTTDDFLAALKDSVSNIQATIRGGTKLEKF